MSHRNACTSAARSCAFVMALAAVALGICASGVRAQDENLVVVFDGSGSMWGRFEGGGPKFEAAREALRTALTARTPYRTIGITGYGWRQRGSCGTSEVVQDLGPVDDIDTLLSPLDRWNPRGRGPIGTALASAGQQLKNVEAPRRILVVHDDPDNCDVDVCRIAEDLKADMPDLRIDSVGLRDPSTPPVFDCVAKITGGRALEMTSSAELETALADVLAPTAPEPEVATPTPEPERAKETQTAAPAQVQPPSPVPYAAGVHSIDGPMQLLALARLKGQSAPTSAPVQWTIIRRQDGSQQATISKGEPLRRLLEPGDYQIRAESGSFQSTFEAEVRPDKTTVLVVEFEAAELSVKVVGLDAPGFPDPFLHLADDAGNELAAVVSRQLPARLVAPGTYRLSSTLGLVNQTGTFELAAGTVNAAQLSIPVGRLQILSQRNVSAPGPGGPLIRVLQTDFTRREAGEIEIARSVVADPTFLVPAGDYIVEKSGFGTPIRRRVSVAAGATVQVRPETTGGVIRLKTVIQDDTVTPTGDATYLISADDGRTLEPIRLYRAEVDVTLEPGRYRIAASLPAYGLRSERTFIVTPGMLETVAVVHAVGRVELHSDASSGGEPGGATIWNITDPNNQRVWRDIGNSATAFLPPGSYTVRAFNGAKTHETQITVKLGQSANVRF